MPFGLLPFGDVAPWGGPGTISLITILAIGTNELVAFFTAPPKCRDPLGFRDARNPLYWSIAPVDPVAIGFNGEVVPEPGKPRPQPPAPWIGRCFVDALDPTQVHLVTVPQLQTGVQYDVTIGPVRGAACESFSGLSTFRLLARTRPPSPPQGTASVVSTYRDYANPVFEIDKRTSQVVPGPGFWQYDETGEIRLDDAEGSLKKRVLRRITTLAGGFAHLPRYGVPPMLGTIARGDDLQALALRLQEQIRNEPDVRDAAVSVSADALNGVVRFELVVQQRQIGEISFRVQVPTT